MSATSASITSSLGKSPRRTKRRSTGPIAKDPQATKAAAPSPGNINRRDSLAFPQLPKEREAQEPDSENRQRGLLEAAAYALAKRERQSDYDNLLTHAIWNMATTNANPAVDLLVCLERRQTIGFRYADITRAVVIHHGSKDTRVPVENVKWLGKTMRNCEVRVLDGEGHGLMASAGVMGNVLMEMAKEWEDWTRVTRGRGGHERRG